MTISSWTELILPIINLLHWMAGLFLMALSYFCWERRQSALARHLLIFVSCTGIWALLAALMPLVPSLASKQLIKHWQIVFVSFIPVACFYLSTSLMLRKPLAPVIRILAAFIPTITALINILPPFRELHFHSIQLVSLWGSEVLAFSNGPWFTVHILWSQVLMITSLILITVAPSPPAKEKFQLGRWYIFLAFGIPYFFDVLAVLHFPTLRFVQLTPMMLSLTSLMLYRGLFRHHILEALPHARSMVLDAIEDLYLVFNRDDRLVDYNEIAQDVLGLNTSHLLQEVHDLEKQMPNLKLKNFSFADHFYQREEHDLEGRSGRLVLFKDLTLQHKLNQIKTQLLGVMGHDLTGHLASLALIGEDLRKNAKKFQTTEIEGQGEFITQATRNCMAMIDELVVWAKSDLGKLNVYLERVSLRLLFEEVIEFMLPVSCERGVDIELDLPDDFFVQTDIRLFKVLFRNVLSNAMKASSEGQTILIKCQSSGSQFVLTIQDQGVGMAEERVTELMSDRKVTQKGFGMIVVRAITRHLKGELHIESEPGKGSLFRFTFPVRNVDQIINRVPTI